MNTQNQYQLDILTDLRNKRNDLMTNAEAFRQELERLNEECSRLVQSGLPTSDPRLQDNHESRHSVNEHMNKLNSEALAYCQAIEKLKA